MRPRRRPTRTTSPPPPAPPPPPRPPPAFHAHMMEGETAAMRDMPEDLRKLLGNYEGLRSPDLLPQADARALQAHAHDITAAAGLTRAAELSQLPLLADELLGQAHLFPDGRLDQDLQQVDLRGRNSWRLQMDEVPSVELLATQLVNAVAPFIITARLNPLMLRTPDGEAPPLARHTVPAAAVYRPFYRNLPTPPPPP